MNLLKMDVLLSYLDFLSIGLTYVFSRYDVPDHLNVGFPGCGQSFGVRN